MKVHARHINLLLLLLIPFLNAELSEAVPFLHHAGRYENQSSYDFIIVGGGTAGLTLAARLTESGDQSVLVLEAGSEPDLVQQYKSPGSDISVLGGLLDWGFTTEPEETLFGRTITYNRGRGLGGSSLINGLTYSRGSKSIYNLWQSLGNDGWSWTDVFPLFKKSTHFNPSKLNSSYMEFDPKAYGDGPLQVGYPGYVTPASVAFVEALPAVNVSPIADLNSGNGVGTKQETMTLDASYQRSSSYDSFYAVAKDRPNLMVKKGAFVTRVMLEQGASGLAAKGVIYTDYLGGATVNATATKEVIMSAGTFQTPQLLMLSGIGPKDVMEGVGVRQIYLDNPNVGQHMQDHSYFSIYVRAKPSTSFTALYANTYNIQEAEMEYITKRTGQLTAPIGPCFGFEQISSADLEAAGATDLLMNRTDQAHTEYLLETDYFPNIPVAGYHPMPGESYISVTAAIVAPSSRGDISLRSNSAEDAPAINVNYLQSEADQKLAIRNFRNLRKILAEPVLKQWTIGENNGEVAPGPSVESDEDILNYIRSDTWPVWHACGTCRMLPEDQGGVVDERLRVYGVSGLRIVDASIIPVIPDSHTQAAVYMIAEKAAVMLAEDWGF